MEKREALRPFKKQRLTIEAVLVHIIAPTKRNDYTHGFVFASVCAPNQEIELDHVVIEVRRNQIGPIDKMVGGLERFKRYRFTAEVAVYHKKGPILGVIVQQECYMLKNINERRIEKIETSSLTQPTIYTKNRIQNVLLCKHREVEHTEEELLSIIGALPDDGAVEAFLQTYTQAYQEKVMTHEDITNAIYARPTV